MSQINDLKSTSLTDLGYIGTFNDKEYAWLFDQGCTIPQLNDRWMCFLRGQGYTGTLNDMMRQWLLGKGYTGSLMDMIKQALEDGNFYSGSEPLFYAATYDRDTYELMVQLIGVGVPTSTHTADLYAPDYLGIYREFGADEPVWSGVRWVETLLTYSEDFSNAAWNKGLGATVDGTNILNFPSVNASVNQNIGAITGGKHYVARVKLSGSGTTTIRAYGPANGSLSPINITLQSTPTIYTISFYAASNDSSMSFYIQRLTGNTATQVTATDAQLEDITAEVNVGIIDQPPGEYIPTEATAVTKWYANENGNSVTDNVVTEAVGAPLPEQPYLVSQPAATNLITDSRDLTGWAAIATPIVSYDQVGITGEDNTATYVEDADVSGYASVAEIATVADSSNPITSRIWIKKDNDEARYPAFRFRLTSGSAELSEFWQINTKTGAVINVIGSDTTLEVIDAGDWWLFLLSGFNNSTGNIIYRTYIYPAYGTVWGAASAAATGSVIVGQVEVYDNKTIEDVIDAGPIFTEGTAVSTDAVNPTYDAGNHNNLESGYYMEIDYTGDDTDVLTVDGNLLRIGDGVVGPQLNTGFTLFGTGWSDNGDGSYSSDGSQTGNDVLRELNVYTGDIAGKFFILRFTITERSAGTISYVKFAGVTISGLNLTALGDYEYILVSDGSATDLQIVANPDFHGTIANVETFEAGKTLQLTDGTNLVEVPIAAGEHKVGISYGESKMDLNLNGAWAGEVAHDGSFGTGAIIQGETAREVKRIDASYDQSKTWVNGEMVNYVTWGNFDEPLTWNGKLINWE